MCTQSPTFIGKSVVLFAYKRNIICFRNGELIVDNQTRALRFAIRFIYIICSSNWNWNSMWFFNRKNSGNVSWRIAKCIETRLVEKRERTKNNWRMRWKTRLFNTLLTANGARMVECGEFLITLHATRSTAFYWTFGTIGSFDKSL